MCSTKVESHGLYMSGIFRPMFHGDSPPKVRSFPSSPPKPRGPGDPSGMFPLIRNLEKLGETRGESSPLVLKHALVKQGVPRSSISNGNIKFLN